MFCFRLVVVGILQARKVLQSYLVRVDQALKMMSRPPHGKLKIMWMGFHQLHHQFHHHHQPQQAHQQQRQLLKLKQKQHELHQGLTRTIGVRS